MHVRRIAALIIGLAFAAPGSASAAQTEQLAYRIMFGGLHVGDLMVILDDSDAGYRTSMRAWSRGVVERFSKAGAELEGEGTYATDTTLTLPTAGLKPTVFRRGWLSEEAIAATSVVFDPVTGRAQAQEHLFRPSGEPATPEELGWGRGNREARVMPEQHLINVLDPMSAFVAARQQVMKGARSFRLPIFDGRRRYDVIGTVDAPRAVTINDVSRTLIPIRTRMEPVAGFRGRRLEMFTKGEGRIYLTTDGRAIPVQVMVGNEIATVVMNLMADCKIEPAACADLPPVEVPSTETAQTPAGQ
jgi:hypothetical protein